MDDDALDQVAERSVIKQWMYCMLVYLPAVAPGMSLGSTGLLAISLDTKFNMSINQISWFASSTTISTPFGSLCSGFISDKFGRLVALQCINIIVCIGLAAIALSIHTNSGQFPILIFGRVLTGFSTGLCSVLPIYIAEVASVKLRPIFTSLSTTFFSLGILLVFLYALAFEGNNWALTPVFAQMYPLCSILLTTVLLPETPLWLISKGNIDKARKNLRRIYGKNGETLVENDLKELIENFDNNKHMRKIYYGRYMFKEPTIYLPFLIMTVYFFIQQFSGVMVFVFYAIHITIDVHIPMNFHLAIILIAITRVITSILVSLINEKIGKRVTTIISGIGVTLTLYGLAIMVGVFGATSEKVLLINQWISTLFLITYMVFSTIGFLTVPFGMVAELFPLEVRGIMVGLTVATAYIYTFLAVKSYLILRIKLTKYAIFIIYGTVALFGTIFLGVFLPETRNKTFEQIQSYFRVRGFNRRR